MVNIITEGNLLSDIKYLVDNYNKNNKFNKLPEMTKPNIRKSQLEDKETTEIWKQGKYNSMINLLEKYQTITKTM